MTAASWPRAHRARGSLGQGGISDDLAGPFGQHTAGLLKLRCEQAPAAAARLSGSSQVPLVLQSQFGTLPLVMAATSGGLMTASPH